MSQTYGIVKRDGERQDLLEDFLGRLAPKMHKVLPRHLTAERLTRVVLVEASRNPKLRECDGASLAASVVLAGQLGLEPSSPLGHFYLIPRWNGKKRQMECTSLIGYKGLLELARRSGQIVRANASVVYMDEATGGYFEASIEPPRIEHRLALKEIDRSPDAIAFAYCVVELKDGGMAQVILTRQEIDARKDRSQSAGKGFSPWQSDYAAMARKSAIRALLMGGTVPMSAELQRAVYEDPEEQIIDIQADEAPTRAKGKAALGLASESPALPDHGSIEQATEPEPERVPATNGAHADPL